MIAGVVPSFLASFSCCAPTVLLLLGAGAAGAVISIIPFARRLERTTILAAA